MKPAKNIRSLEVKLGKIGLLVLVVGMGVLVLLTFLFGVQVGRDIDNYPEKIARVMPARIADRIGSFFARPAREGDPKTQENQPLDLAFFEILIKRGKNTGGDMLPEEKKDTPAPPAVILAPGMPAKPLDKEAPTVPAPHPPPLAPATGAPPPGGVSAGNGKNPAPAAPGAVTPETRPPVAEKEGKKTEAGGFSVQVVSYQEREKAEQLRAKLRGLGYRAEITETDISGKGKWYRVVVNGYQTRKAAEKAAVDMAAKVKGLSCAIKKH